MTRPNVAAAVRCSVASVLALRRARDVDVHSDLSERAMGWGTARWESAAPLATESIDNPPAKTTRTAHGERGEYTESMESLTACHNNRPPTTQAAGRSQPP